MADPFSIGVGVVGVLGLSIQIAQIVRKFGLHWRDAPKDIKTFKDELEALNLGLTEVRRRILDNPAYELAFGGDSSAITSHLKANDTSEDSIKLAFEKSQIHLSEAIESLRIKASGPVFDWKRLKEVILSDKVRDAVSSLHIQYKIVGQLLSIDTARLTANSYIELKGMRKEHHEWHTALENQNILKWLSQINFEDIHRDILSKLHPGTGQWLLDSDEFKAWRNGHRDTPPNLWCPGNPGAGKSVLAAKVIDHLQRLFHQDDIAVLFLYCDYKDRQNQTDRRLFASLAKQSVLQQKELPSGAKELYDRDCNRKTSPYYEDSIELLRVSITQFRRTFVVIDALDEHLPIGDDESITEIKLLTSLLNMQQKTAGRLTMLITSRKLDSIGSQLRRRTRLEIRANDDDIRSYVASRIINNFPFAEEVRENPGFGEEIIKGVVQKACGMFLLPRLHLDRLANQITIRNVRKTLGALPTKIDEIYEDAIVRIKNQGGEHRELALRALSWISKAKRPLRVVELCHAVSVELGDLDVGEESLVSSSLITSVCAGLVSIDSESNTFRLVHFTIEEFFQKKGHELIPSAEKMVTETCLTYLLFDTLEEGPLTGWNKLDRWMRYPLLSYAAKFWGEHATLAIPDVEELLKDFLGNEKKVANIFDYNPFTHDHGEPIPGLCLLAKGGYTEIMKFWIRSCTDINASIFNGETPLILAALNNHLTAARLLISHRAEVNATNSKGQHALMAFFWAVATGDIRYFSPDVPKLLLESGADVNVKDIMRETCLHLAADGYTTDFTDGHKYIDILLDAGADLEACNNRGLTPLLSSLENGHCECVIHLLRRGAKLDFTTYNNKPPVLVAVKDKRVLDIVRSRIASDSPAICEPKTTTSVVDIEEAAELLIQEGFSLKARRLFNKTVLLITAPSSLAARFVDALLNAGIEADTISQDEEVLSNGDSKPRATELERNGWARLPLGRKCLHSLDKPNHDELESCSGCAVQMLLFWGMEEAEREEAVTLFTSEVYDQDGFFQYLPILNLGKMLS